MDANIFQRLIDREVPGRMLPKGLDIAAAFGSDEALSILTEMGETNYTKYTSQMDKLRAYITGFPASQWTENLYWGWMHTLQPLAQKKGSSYPEFMKSVAWSRKQLNTFLGSWTELKHDTILYAKQVYAEMGGSIEAPERDDRGYVEPEPELYARLGALVNATQTGLETLGILPEGEKKNLAIMAELVLTLETIANKELSGIKLTDEEYEFIRSYGGQLEHLWLAVNKEDVDKSGLDQRNFLDQNPAALVADVATDPNGQVLEEATGFISTIYVLVPWEGGKRKMMSGGVYSYYEFPWPMSDRLTDTKWREILRSGGDRPKFSEWTGVFMAQP